MFDDWFINHFSKWPYHLGSAVPLVLFCVQRLYFSHIRMVTEKIETANFPSDTLYCSEDKIYNEQFKVLAVWTHCGKLIHIHIVRLLVVGKTPRTF